MKRVLVPFVKICSLILSAFYRRGHWFLFCFFPLLTSPPCLLFIPVSHLRKVPEAFSSRLGSGGRHLSGMVEIGLLCFLRTSGTQRRFCLGA